MKNHPWIKLALLVILVLGTTLPLSPPQPARAASRTVDGDPSDWTGTASTTVHTDAESGGEWIYTGAAGDARTDTGMTDEADLTEVRLTADTTYLYFLFRLADITDTDEVHIGVGIDTDQDGYDSGYNWIGDESNLTLGRAFMYPERILSFHETGSGNQAVEWWAGGSWYGVAGSQISISAANDVVEARVPLNDLNGIDANSDFIITVATFQNNPGWNNDVDTTDDFTTTDAVDVMGIPGQSGNAWSRDLNDGNVYFGWWIQLRGDTNAPTAVVWDRLYHSSCDQLVADNCGAGDHPAEQYVPSAGESTRFVSARRYSDDGTLAPVTGAATDVYAYDDEPVDVYAMAHKDDLTDDTTYPRLRYYYSSGVYVNMTEVDEWTGSWGGTPSTTYEVFSGTIPAQEPGNVYYYFVTRDESGDRAICRTDNGSGAEDHNWADQWVRESGCAANTDYAYTVIDDDVTGPTINDVTFTDNGTNDEVCATVYDTNTRSGDADSGVNTVTLRYSSTRTDVTSGSGGTETAMTNSGGDEYCVNGLNFTDPTYYRVEAKNNDYDNGRAADRDTNTSSTYCEGGSCTGGASNDNDIWWNEVLHNTRDLTYRAPFGALETGETVTLSLRVADGDLTGVTLYLYNTPSGTQTYAMNKISESDIDYDWYEYTVPAADTSVADTLYYKFRLEDGTDQDWYVDDHAHNDFDHEDRYENGTGMMVDNGDDYPENSFNITVYDASAYADHLDSWAQEAVIYQIMPDRFRNGDPTNDQAWPTGYDVYGNGPFNHATWNEAVYDPRDSGGTYYQQWSADFFGGDLQGVIDELDYLQEQGITALYFNPIFASPSNHGYDTTDYLNINPRYGDNALFETLNTEAEARGIKIILDGVFNHTGSDSVYLDRYNRWDADGNPDTGANTSGACEASGSAFANFYSFFGSDGPCYDGNNYASWWGYDSLPNLVDGVADNVVRDFVFDVDNDNDNGIDTRAAVIQFWAARGADGWRFDVADEIPHSFWQQFRAQVKGNDNLDGPLYSEVWFEAVPWLHGDQLDATMNYRYRKAVLGFLIDTTWTDNDNHSDQTMWALAPSEFDYVLGSIREDYPEPAWKAMMNLMDSHDTNRALFVLDQRSTSTADALKKMAMMAALQFTYPGAPTIYYGDEVGLGAVYTSGGEWGAGRTVDGIVQDDPYNRAPYPWPDESGTLDASLPNTALQATYRTLARTRNNYDVLQTGDVTTLLTDDTNNVYAYARTDTNGAPDCAIAIFNRDGGNSRNVDLTVPATCADTTYYDVLHDGNATTATGTTLDTVTLPALESAVLVPAFDNPNTADATASLPPTGISASSTAVKVAPNGGAGIQAQISDLAGQAVPDGVTVNFEIVSGGGNVSSSATTTGGTATATYTAPGSPGVVVARAVITAPDGIAYSDATTLYVTDHPTTIAESTTVETGIGPESVALSGVITATKIGLGEPVISLARYENVPDASNAVGPYVDLHLSDATDVISLTVTVAYTDDTDEANHTLYWKNGTTWQAVSSGPVAVDTLADTLTFTFTTSTTPSLSTLTGTELVAGNPNAGTPTAFTLRALGARVDIRAWLISALLVLAVPVTIWALARTRRRSSA